MDIKGKDLQDLIEEYGVEKINALFLEALGPGIAEALDGQGIDTGRYLRYMPLGHEMKRVRKETKISIQEASSSTKIPQYRLKALERGTFSEIKPEHFQKYVRFLGLEDFVADWARKYPEIAAELVD